MRKNIQFLKLQQQYQQQRYAKPTTLQSPSSKVPLNSSLYKSHKSPPNGEYKPYMINGNTESGNIVINNPRYQIGAVNNYSISITLNEDQNQKTAKKNDQKPMKSLYSHQYLQNTNTKSNQLASSYRRGMQNKPSYNSSNEYGIIPASKSIQKQAQIRRLDSSKNSSKNVETQEKSAEKKSFHKIAFLSNKSIGNFIKIDSSPGSCNANQLRQTQQPKLNRSKGSVSHHRSNSSVQNGNNEVNTLKKDAINQEEDSQGENIQIRLKKNNSLRSDQFKIEPKFKRTKNYNTIPQVVYKVEDDYKNRIHELEAIMRQNKQEFDSRIKEIESQKHKINISYSELMDKITDKNKEIRGKNQQINQLKDELNKKSNKISQIQKIMNEQNQAKSRKNETQQSQASAKAVINNLMVKLNDLQNQNKCLLERITISDKERAFNQNKAKEEEIKNLQLEIKLSEMKEKHQGQLISINNKLKQLNQINKQLQLKLDQKTKQCMKRRQIMADNITQIVQLTRQDDLQREVKSKDKTISHMMKDIKNLQKDLKSFNHTRQILKKTNILLKAANQSELVHQMQNLNSKYKKYN